MAETKIDAVSSAVGTTPISQQTNTITANNIESESLFLENKFKDIQKKQGFIGKSTDSLKELFNIGTNSNDCESTLAKYKQGELSYNDALKKLQEYEESQDSGINLISNIVTGIASIAVATVGVKAGHIDWGKATKLGAPVGAAVKTALKMADRATNDIDDDVLDTKEITKDIISGAVTGTTSAVSSNIAPAIKKGSFDLAIKNGAKCGALCGALAGSTNYITDSLLDDNKTFNPNDLIKNTATSAFVSGTVGGIVGGGIYGLSTPFTTPSGEITSTIIKDSASSSSRKVLGNIERNLIDAA